VIDRLEAAAEAPARRVLIVDPDSRLRADVGAACRQDGFEVVEATSGQEALTRAAGPASRA